MPGPGAALVPLAALFLAGALGQVLSIRPCPHSPYILQKTDIKLLLSAEVFI